MLELLSHHLSHWSYLTQLQRSNFVKKKKMKKKEKQNLILAMLIKI